MEGLTEHEANAQDLIYFCDICNVELNYGEIQSHVASHQVNTAESKVEYEYNYNYSSSKTSQFQCDLPPSFKRDEPSPFSGHSGQFVPKYDYIPSQPPFSQTATSKYKDGYEHEEKGVKMTPQPLALIDLTCDNDNNNYSESPPTQTVTSPWQPKSDYDPNYYNQAKSVQYQSHCQTNLSYNPDLGYFGGTVVQNTCKTQIQTQIQNQNYNQINQSAKHVNPAEKLVQNPTLNNLNFVPHSSTQFQYKSETNPQNQIIYSNPNPNLHAYSKASFQSQQNLNPHQNYKSEIKSSDHFDSVVHSKPQNPQSQNSAQSQFQFHPNPQNPNLSHNPNQIPVNHMKCPNLQSQLFNPEKMGAGKKIEENVIENQHQNQYQSFGGKISNHTEPQKQFESEREVHVDIRIKLREERLKREKEWQRWREEGKRGKKQQQQQLQQKQQHGFHIFAPNTNPQMNSTPMPTNPVWSTTSTSTPAPSTSASVTTPKIRTTVPKKSAPVPTCKFCSETFKHGTDVLRHEIYFHKMSPVDPAAFCKTCGKRYKSKAGLKAHIKRSHQPGRKKSTV